MTAVVINTDVADRGGKAREEITEKQTLHMNSWIKITNRNELAYCEGWSLIAFQVPPNQAILWLHDIIISLLIASLSVNLTSPLSPTPKWVTTVLFSQAVAEKDQVTLQKLPKTKYPNQCLLNSGPIILFHALHVAFLSQTLHQKSTTTLTFWQ